MAKINNTEKLVNQVMKNKGFKDLISCILDNSIVTSNPNNIIEDNPGYLNDILDIQDNYELSDSDIEILAGGVVKALAKTKILHNNDADFTSLLDNFSKESDSMAIAGDIFQLIKAGIQDMSDTDAGTCAVYIAMSLAMMKVFPEGIDRPDVESEVDEETPVEKPSELSGMDLRKFLKGGKKQEASSIEVAASESTDSESTEVQVDELGEEVEVGNGHKARKVKKSKPAKVVQVAASESTTDAQETPDDVETVEVVDLLTEEGIRKEAERIINRLTERFGTEMVDLTKQVLDFDKLVHELHEASKSNELTDEFIGKFMKEYTSNLDSDNKAKLFDVFTKLSTIKASNEVVLFDMMKGIAADDQNINKMLNQNPGRLMMNCLSDTVLNVLDGSAQDAHDLASAARKGDKNIFYHTLANICEGNQAKADAIINAINSSNVTGLRDIPQQNMRVSLRNKKVAAC